MLSSLLAGGANGAAPIIEAGVPYDPSASGSLANNGQSMTATGVPMTNFQQMGQQNAGLDNNSTDNSMMGQFAKLGSGVMSLASAWNAFQQMGLMKDQFDFSKGLAETNLANQAAITNRQLKSQESARSQLMGNKVGSSGYNNDMANATQVRGTV